MTDTEARELAVRTMVTLEFVIHPEPPEVAKRVEGYARALDIDLPMVHAARRLADQQAALLYLDIQRNDLYTAEAIHGILHGTLFELIRSKLAYQGMTPDKKIAEKWHTLEDCPPGSWGRGVADFYHAHHFPFPGDRHGISELGAQHDFVHVLADYDATPEGEIDVFAFIAASMGDSRGFTQFAMTLAPVPERSDPPRRRQEGRDRPHGHARRPRRGAAVGRRRAPRGRVHGRRDGRGRPLRPRDP